VWRGAARYFFRNQAGARSTSAFTMKALRVSAAVSIFSCSLSLLACTAGNVEDPNADPTGTASGASAAAPAVPLLESCSGDYVCAKEGSTKTLELSLAKGFENACTSGDIYFESSQDVTSDAGSHEVLGKWSGDSQSFEICGTGDCLRCKPKDTLSASSSGGARSCTGSTSCSGYQPGDCSSHKGCSMRSHAVYRSGSFDHYENDCIGSTPSCSSHTTESKCKSQGCSWK
jgi:hypothetical protein